jgi:hypothetical protein
MLPIHKAISFVAVLEKGGRTKPWLVLVHTGEQVEPFVVKLFDSEEIAVRDSVVNEVMGNVLAREFQLPVPQAALIEMGPDFIRTIPEPRLVTHLANFDHRVKFGSQQLQAVDRINPQGLSLADLRRMIEVDSVFAFDVLIRNPDRNFVKSNLLVRQNEAYLIDHELGFEITAGCGKELDDWQWKDRFYRYHIFYEHLKHASQGQKAEFFHEFQECLRLLNVDVLQGYWNQLADHGYPAGRRDLVMGYFEEMKQKSAKFVSLLKGLI